MRAKQSKTIKMIADACMTVLLLCLTAYQVTGEVLHEWFGIGMTVLLILHHILNRRWYAALFRGRYNVYRIVTTAINTLLFLSIALTTLCGMSMSAHAVPFLYGMLPVSFARRFHLALSCWSFVLMGVHLGLHIPTMTALWNKKVKMILAVLCTAVAGVGLRVLIRSSSNRTSTPRPLSSRTVSNKMTAFRAKRVIDLARMMSIFPSRQAVSIA